MGGFVRLSTGGHGLWIDGETVEKSYRCRWSSGWRGIKNICTLYQDERWIPAQSRQSLAASSGTCRKSASPWMTSRAPSLADLCHIKRPVELNLPRTSRIIVLTKRLRLYSTAFQYLNPKGFLCLKSSFIFCSPYDGVTVDLQELKELLGLFSVSILLFSRQGVIGNQQRVGPSSWCDQLRLRITPNILKKKKVNCFKYSFAHLCWSAHSSSSWPRCCDNSLRPPPPCPAEGCNVNDVKSMEKPMKSLWDYLIKFRLAVQ